MTDANLFWLGIVALWLLAFGVSCWYTYYWRPRNPPKRH